MYEIWKGLTWNPIPPCEVVQGGPDPRALNSKSGSCTDEFGALGKLHISIPVLPFYHLIGSVGALPSYGL